MGVGMWAGGGDALGMSADVPTLKLKPRAPSRAVEGHPWIFAGHVQKLPGAEWDGKTVFGRDGNGRFLGSGIFNSRSQIVWRRFSRERVAFDANYLAAALAAAVGRRKADAARRLVWSESDFIPGLVVDEYEGVVVAQFLTRAVDDLRDTVVDLLAGLLRPQAVVVRNDAGVRAKEGLPVGGAEVVRGDVPENFEVEIGGIRYGFDPVGGQKTGFYLDQREQHVRVGGLARGRRVLDVFCNQGGFALQAARNGAARVMGVDSSPDAITAARANAARNGLSVEWTEANAFDYLRTLETGSWDLIVLDPPPFAHGKGGVDGALRGYREIHVRAFKALAPGGLLATYTCSHRVGMEMFRGVAAESAVDAHREVRVLDVLRQPEDHPVLLNFPESEYLHGLLLEVA